MVQVRAATEPAGMTEYVRVRWEVMGQQRTRRRRRDSGGFPPVGRHSTSTSCLQQALPPGLWEAGEAACVSAGQRQRAAGWWTERREVSLYLAGYLVSVARRHAFRVSVRMRCFLSNCIQSWGPLWGRGPSMGSVLDIVDRPAKSNAEPAGHHVL